MLALRPAILEFAAGGVLLAGAAAQSLTEAVPAPVGDFLTPLLTAAGLGGMLSWAFKSWVTNWLTANAEERKQEVWLVGANEVLETFDRRRPARVEMR